MTFHSTEQIVLFFGAVNVAVVLVYAVDSTRIYKLPEWEPIEEEMGDEKVDDKEAPLVGSNMRPSVKRFATRRQ